MLASAETYSATAQDFGEDVTVTINVQSRFQGSG
jgi:hypothetical protein